MLVKVSVCAQELGVSTNYVRKLLNEKKLKQYGQELGIVLVDLEEAKEYKNTFHKSGRKSSK